MSNAPARTRRNTYAQCTRRDHFQNTSAILRLNWIWERDAEAFLQKTVSQNKMYGHQERIEEERCLSSEERRYTFYSCRVFKLKPEWVRSVSGACAPVELTIVVACRCEHQQLKCLGHELRCRTDQKKLTVKENIANLSTKTSSKERKQNRVTKQDVRSTKASSRTSRGGALSFIRR